MTQFDPFARQAHAASTSGHSAFLVPPVFRLGLGPRTAARSEVLRVDHIIVAKQAGGPKQ